MADAHLQFVAFDLRHSLYSFEVRRRRYGHLQQSRQGADRQHTIHVGGWWQVHQISTTGPNFINFESSQEWHQFLIATDKLLSDNIDHTALTSAGARRETDESTLLVGDEREQSKPSPVNASSTAGAFKRRSRSMLKCAADTATSWVRRRGKRGSDRRWRSRSRLSPALVDIPEAIC